MKLYLRALGLFALVYMGILVGFSSPIYAQNRQVRAWGNNVEGTLGDGTNTDSNTPVQVSGLTNVVQISCGNGSSLALKSDGTVWAWGYNGFGQLGNGTTASSNTPIQVSGLTNVVQISCGYTHSLALKSDGTVWAWGYNDYGQLGDGSTTSSNTPIQVSGLTNVIQVSGGMLHSLALKSDRTVWAWGYNGSGQLGDGTNTLRKTPVQVSGLTNVTQVEGGFSHTLALKSDGTVWAWGYNGSGQLGDGTTTDSNTPVQTSDITGATQIDAGSNHSLSLKSDGTVWAWGGNYDGELGDGTNTDRNTPVQFSDITGVTQIAAGDAHSLAVKSDGTVWACGLNTSGQLGNGTTDDSVTPVAVSGYHEVASIAGGDSHSLALYRAPTIYMSNTTLKYGQRSRLLARLYNAVTASGVAGVSVTFKIDGTTVGSATTVDNGSGLTYAQVNPYTINDSLTVGTHTLTASYDGSNGTDLANSKDVTLTVAQTDTSLAGINASAKLGDKIALRAKLTRTTDNNAVSGQTITFKVDGTTVGTGTSVASDGTATFSGYDTSSLSVGTHTLTAEYVATTNYKASSSSATLTISKADTTLAANSATRSRGQIQVLSARLWNSQNGSYLSGKTVTFKIDGTTVGTGSTGADGYARYSYTVSANATVGAHTITAVFDGDTSYNTSTGSATLTVN